MSDGPSSDGTDRADAACLSAVKDVLAAAPERRHDALAHNVIEFGLAFVACLQRAAADPVVEVLSAPAAREVLAFLIGVLPDGSRLVLTSRSEPELGLARLRAAGDVLDVQWTDLRLDAGETREMLQIFGVRVTDEQAEMLCERAEGWAAGISLAALSWRQRPVTDELLTLPTGPPAEVARYLLEEVLQRRPPELQRFLLASSLLRRMSPELCDAALEIEDSAQMLSALEHSSLFLVPLDGGCYRYHHLFGELLQAELHRRTPEVIPGIRERAAAWHESHDHPGEAFEYAHACGDMARAGRILMGHGQELMTRGRLETVRGWLQVFTAEQLASDPQLALGGAWIALQIGDSSEAQRLAAAAAAELDALPQQEAAPLRLQLANLRATLAPEGIYQMLRDGELVCAAEDLAGTPWVLFGWRAVGTAHLYDGRADEAIGAFSEVLRVTRGHSEYAVVRMTCLGYAALAAADTGDWRRARKWARESHALLTDCGLEQVLQSAAPYTAQATVLQHDGLLRQAGEALENARRISPLLRAMRCAEADINLRCADVSLSLGDLEGALELADQARAALIHYPDAGTLPDRLVALDARLRSGGNLKLTPSELRLVPFLASHLSLQEIGDRVFLSRATVKTHTNAIYRKLSASSRSAAVERLEQLGFFR